MNKLFKLFFFSFILSLFSGCTPDIIFDVLPIEEDNKDWIGLWENDVIVLEIFENGWCDFSDSFLNVVWTGSVRIDNSENILHLAIPQNNSGITSIGFSIIQHPLSSIIDNKIEEFIIISTADERNERLIRQY